MRKILLPLLAAAFWYVPAPVQAQAFPDGPGKEILEKQCSTCHAPDMVRTFGRSADEWHEVVIAMVDQGAKLSDDEIPVLVEYLAKNWPVKGAAGAPASITAAAPAPAPPAAPVGTSAAAAPPSSTEMPGEYKTVLDTLGRTGD